MNRRANVLYFLANDRIFVIRISVKYHGFAKMDSVFDRKGKQSQGEEERKGRSNGEGWHIQHFRDGPDVVKRGGLLLRTDDGYRDNWRIRLEGQAHKSLSKLLELIPLVEGLADAASTLWKHQNSFVRFEKSATILGEACDLPTSREKGRYERERWDPFFNH